MSSELMKKISGQLTDTQGVSLSQLPFGITIEMNTLQTSPPGPGGWIGSAPVKTTGGYELFTAYDIGLSESVGYQIFKDDQPVASGNVLVTNNVAANIALTQDQIDTLMTPDVNGSITIKGAVTLRGSEDFVVSPPTDMAIPSKDVVIAAVPLDTASIYISISKIKFGTTINEIATGSIDIYGNYCIKVPVNLLNNSTPSATTVCCDQWNLSKIFVALVTGYGDAEVIIERSANITITQECISVDIQTAQQGEFSQFHTEIDNLTTIIQTATSMDPILFHTLTTDGDDSDLNEIIALTGFDAGLISNRIYASKIAEDTGIGLNHCYALTKSEGNNTAAWIKLDFTMLSNIVINAIYNNVINNTDDINATFNILSNQRIDSLAAAQTDNGDTISRVLGTLLTSDADVRTFLTLDDQYAATDPQEFWNQIDIELPGQKALLQQGLQVLSLTGMQPEMTSHIISLLGGEPGMTSPPSLRPTSSLISNDQPAWLAMIEAVCTGSGKLCVPQAIIDAANLNGTDPKVDYSFRLNDVTNDTFATAVINARIASDSVFSGLLGDHASPVQAFLTNNPDFDFRVNNVWDLSDEQIPDYVNARKVIAPIQNVMRLTAGKPDAVVALMKSGVQSSADIAAMSLDSFVTNFATTLGGTAQAQQIYTQANQTALVVGNIQTFVTSDVLANPIAATLSNLTPQWLIYLNNNAPVNAQAPDLTSLFGNMDYCNCSDCMSMYSPAAYFTDILNFIQTQIGTNAYNELLRRRPDLTNIDLSCKNSNTPLPYTDLVNEILERKILDFHNNVVTPTSYQTSLTAAELAAYPEHTIKQGIVPAATYVADNSYKTVYDTILSGVSSAVYPTGIPFNLAIEETRTYLNHLGYTRYNLMMQYKPKYFYTAADTDQTIIEYNADAEWLAITKKDVDIITTSTITGSGASMDASAWRNYGFKAKFNLDYEIPTPPNIIWYEQLCNNISPQPPITLTVSGLKTLIDKAGISYTELLQVLGADFLNPVLTGSSNTPRTLLIEYVYASSSADTGQDTCDLGKLKLVYGDPLITDPVIISNAKILFFDKLFRFVRLYKATGWSIYQLDMILASLSATDINVASFKEIAAIHQICATLGFPPENVASFWSILNHTTYLNYNSDTQNALPTVYDKLFQNKAVINPPDTVFQIPVTAVSYAANHKGTILAATNFTEDELDLVWKFVTTDLTITLSTLSRVYAISVLTRGMNISVDDLLLQVFKLNNLNNSIFSGSPQAVIAALQAIINDIQNLNSTAFSLDETDYLLRGYDPVNVFATADSTIELFYEGLRTDLKKQNDAATGQAASNKDTLGNIAIREFSTNFTIDSGVAQCLLQGITTVTPVSGSTNISTAVQKSLLRITVTTTGGGSIDSSLYDVLTDTVFINATDAIASSTGATLPVTGGTILISELYDAYVKANKIAFIVTRLGISIAEFIAALMGDITTTVTDVNGVVIPPVTTTPALRTLFSFPYLENIIPTSIDTLPPSPLVPYVDLQSFFNLADWIAIRNRLNLQSDGFIAVLEAINTTTSTTNNYLTTLVTYTGWDIVTLTYLVGGSSNILGVTNADATDYKNATLLSQIADIMDSSSLLGLSPEIIYSVLRADITLDNSVSVRQAAKAKYTDDQWATIAKPLQDVLREKQRQALLAYVVANPDVGDSFTAPISALRWRDSNGVFAYYLIDVEMKPAMMTSRLKQGISSLQLYVLRLIQNLENTDGNTTQHLTMNPTQIKQWEQWRKWYRVWEANREVFLYPENWMVPSLRDDKTELFKDLETQLQQDEITDDTAADALSAYLDELDEIAKLEPFTAYHEIQNDPAGNVTVDIKHVFARSNSEPQHYYYRTLQNNAWSPWEKITIDIKSSHIVPLMWNGRLYLFWLTYTAKQYNDPTFFDTNYSVWVNKIQKLNSDGNNIMQIVSDDNQDDKQTVWDIKLNWSQYKNGKWLATEMCEDVMTLAPWKIWLTEQEAASFGAYSAADLRYWYFMTLSNNGELNLSELFKSRLYLTAYFDVGANTTPLVLSLKFYARPDDQGAMDMYSFIFPDPVSQPYVERWMERISPLLSPIGTQAKNMKFHEIQSGNQSANNKLKIEAVVPFQDTHWLYCYNWYKPAAQGDPNYNGMALRTRRGYGSGGDVLLNSTPDAFGAFKLTRFGNSADGNFSTIRDYFFYEDDKNTYYVQKNLTAIGKAISTISLVGTPVTSLTLKQTGFAATQNFQTATSTNATVAANLTASSFASLLSKLPSVNGSLQLSPAIHLNATTSATPAFATTATQAPLYYYSFQTFYHAQIHQFRKALNESGVDGLLQLSNQQQTDSMQFGPPSGNLYQPTNLVSTPYPANNVQFASTDPYSIYNWELFFHAPMLIAQGLSDNQQFEDAQKWYHYIFNPTSSTDGVTGQPSGTVSRFWKFEPFYKIATAAPQTLNDLLIALNDIANNSSNNNQVTAMQTDPFNPFVIARMRNLSFMKNVVMKYLDNLIAWGDQLFREDTIESLNEATQIYILAANILGPQPESIPPRAVPTVYTYQELLTASNNNLGPLSDPLVDIESFFGPNTGVPTGTITSSGSTTGVPVYGKMFYFCIPPNDILLGYWDTVADRLFKIRNSMNIDGVAQQLPIYDPPINPALLVRAAAMGIDISSIVDASLSGSAGMLTANYRFTYMLQKANEFCVEVRSLGAALLAALEKKDAEGLALLHSSQEMTMLDQVTFIKESQVSEAQAALDALNLTKDSIQIRYDYYSSRPFTNNYEQQQLASVQTGLVLQAVQGVLEGTASTMAIVPTVHIQGLASGASDGGLNYASALRGTSAALGIATAINNAKGSMAGTMGGYQRRSDDWVFQTNTASKDLEQIDQQILGAQIRLDIANRELSNHQLQIKNSKAVDDYLRGKFTNQDLYTWMSGQIASTYFQSYQLAYDLAKKADNCYNNELPASTKYPAGGFITFGYWDSLKKGLLSGENLQFDLRRMESAYMDDNIRELELTKHISLAIFDPAALLNLRENGSCDTDIVEAIFDMDYPGHYLRRIKSVSISIPCIAGPYTTINCVLTQSSSRYRKSPEVGTAYKESTTSPDGDNRFKYFDVSSGSIATSSAQNDSGVFELNFRDERYLPFENSGAISTWHIEFPSDIAQFDPNTISDVIMHIKYTARDGGSALKDAANTYTSGLIYNNAETLLPRYFSTKHEFTNDWYKGFNTLVPPTVGAVNVGHQIDMDLLRSQFPEYARKNVITISKIDLYITPVTSGDTYLIAYTAGGSTTIVSLAPAIAPNIPYTGTLSSISIVLPADSDSVDFKFVLYKGSTGSPVVVDESELEDLFFIAHYKLT